MYYENDLNVFMPILLWDNQFYRHSTKSVILLCSERWRILFLSECIKHLNNVVISRILLLHQCTNTNQRLDIRYLETKTIYYIICYRFYNSHT